MYAYHVSTAYRSSVQSLPLRYPVTRESVTVTVTVTLADRHGPSLTAAIMPDWCRLSAGSFFGKQHNPVGCTRSVASGPHVLCLPAYDRV